MCLLRGTFYILRSAHTGYLCVLCGSQNKQRLFHCTALTDWLDFITDEMCLLRGTFYILRSAHTVHLCVLCGSQNKQRLFHCTALTDWLVFVTETECVYCAVRTEYSSIIQVKYSLERSVSHTAFKVSRNHHSNEHEPLRTANRNTNSKGKLPPNQVKSRV